MFARSTVVLARAVGASRHSSTLAATATKSVTSAATPAAATSGASASITTAATTGTMGSPSPAAAKHLNYAGKVMSRSR